MQKIGMLKSYKNAQLTRDYGVRCVVNMPREFPLHHHDYFELEIVVKGEVYHECNGIGMMCHRGDAYILSPYDVHLINASPNTELYNLCIYTEQCNKTLARLLLEERYPRFGSLTEDEMREFAALHSELREELAASSPYRETRVMARTALLATRFLEKTVAKEEQKSSQSYSTVARTMMYIEEHLSEPIALEEVAAAAGYSRTYFCRLFKEIVGINFRDYLARERINLACDLLADSGMSITEIAYAVGYDSFSSFWRNFKRYKGVSPSEIRGF